MGVSSRVAVVGCGHVGSIMASGLAELGHRVVGVDINVELVNRLCQGDVPYHEAGLPELVDRGLSSGRLMFTTSFDHAVPDSDVIFLAVDTPQSLAGAGDIRNVRAATRSIASALQGTTPIVVNKSTAPVGTAETIETILAGALPADAVPPVAVNPEFLRQGRAVHDFFNPERIVVGSRRAADAQAVADLYDGLPGERVVTDLRTAETVKYVANSFLATRISFINEIARICDALGVDIDAVIEGVGHDPRIGHAYLSPGIGYGGSCLPKDVAALRYTGDAAGAATPLLAAVQQVNVSQRAMAILRLRSLLGGLEGRRIGVWGLTFKGGTEDLRDSPALEIVGLLLNEGVDVRVFEPTVPTGLPPRIAATVVDDPLAAVAGADALAVLAEWSQFRDIPLQGVRAAMRGDVLYDGRNVLPRQEAEQAGFRYVGVGRAATSPKPAEARP